MGVETAVVAGLASTALSAKQQSDQAAAMGRATGERNSAIAVAADQTRANQMAQLDYKSATARQNIATQDTATRGALAATSAARGILGSRTARTLDQNVELQSGVRLEDLAANTMLEEAQIDTNWANALNGRQSYQAPSSGLMLLGAGLQGLQTGLSVYQVSKNLDPVNGWSPITYQS